MFKRWMAVALLCLSSIPVPLFAEEYLVLTSNRPLTLLAREVLGDGVSVREVSVTTNGGHHGSLRISERQALEDAALVIWLGPELEPGLAHGLIDSGAKLLDVSVVPIALASPPVDMHVWLDSRNALAIAANIGETADRLGLAPSQRLTERVKKLAASLADLDKKWRPRFGALDTQEFVALHDAYRYLAAYFDWQPLGYLVDAQDNPIGPRSRWQLEQALTPYSRVCLFAMPQYRSAVEQVVARQPMLAPFNVDILATEVQDAGYAAYYEGLLMAAEQCLALTSR